VARSGRAPSSLSPRAALALLGFFAVLALVVWLLNAGGQPGSIGAAPTPTIAAGATVSAGAGVQRSTPPGTLPERPSASAPVTAKARYVLAVVDATGRGPAGYVGGRQFMNDQRGGTTALPHRDAGGHTVIYHEYDVNPRTQGVDRGPQRLVVGSDGSAFVTADHYVTWQRLR
jgi:guanyl-specific ribonuclease Sa